MRVVIVGNGVAGIEAALATHARQPGWEITIVSEESDHFFSRTALMYVLSGQLSRPDIEPHPRDLYARHGFRRVRARATGLDVVGRRLILGGGQEPLSYDRLLLSCGSRPRPGPWPGSDLTGVGHFVTLQDLSWLEAEIHGARSRGGDSGNEDGHRASSAPGSPYWQREVARTKRGRSPHSPVVVGGGLIGCEVVETLLSAGLRPRFLIKQRWFWPAFLDEAEARFVEAHLRDHSVEVGLDEEVSSFEAGADGTVARVHTSRGEHPCDLAIIAIGVAPHTGWLGEAVARDADGGILVDDRLRTSAPDVYAAGDCASVRWADGRQRPEQLWYTARDQGRVAGRALAGEEASYGRGTWYNSAKFLDLEYTTVGLVEQGVPGEQSWRYEERGPVRSSTRIIGAKGRLIGFNALGRRWDHSVLARWIEEGRSPEFCWSNLERARFDTELVPPPRLPALEAAR